MSTNPQSPQGSPSEARGSQSHPHPVAEGRQSPGLDACPFCGGKPDYNADRAWIHCPTCGAQGPFPTAKPAEDWNRRALAAPGAPQGDVQDPRTDREVVDALASVAMKLGAEGGELGSEEELEGAKLDILDRLKYFRSCRATPSQEEGPAGVDLEAEFRAIEEFMKRAGLFGSEKIREHVRTRAERAIRRLRAQAPASSPRDLEAVRDILVSIRDADGDDIDKIAERCTRQAAEALAILNGPHPPKGETPSEAAGLETVARVMAIGLKAAYNWHKTQLASEASLAGHPMACLPEGEGMAVLEGIQQWEAWNAAPDQNRIKTGSADTMLALQLEFEALYLPHKAELRKVMNEWCQHRTPNDLLALIRANLKPAAPGTPIEKAAREYVEAERNFIDKRSVRNPSHVRMEAEESRCAAWTNLCVAVDGWKPDARASLSSLPQESRPCGTCGGTRKVDSGGQDGAGNWIERDCPECAQEPAAGEGGAG